MSPRSGWVPAQQRLCTDRQAVRQLNYWLEIHLELVSRARSVEPGGHERLGAAERAVDPLVHDHAHGPASLGVAHVALSRLDQAGAAFSDDGRRCSHREVNRHIMRVDPMGAETRLSLESLGERLDEGGIGDVAADYRERVAAQPRAEPGL